MSVLRHLLGVCIILSCLSGIKGQTDNIPIELYKTLDEYFIPLIHQLDQHLRKLENSATKLLQRVNGLEHQKTEVSQVPGKEIASISTENHLLNEEIKKLRHFLTFSQQVPRSLNRRQVGEEVVAFYTILGHTISDPGTNFVIVFDKVITNRGYGYSNNTGAFTCPRGGVYVFSWTVRMSGDNGRMSTVLVKNAEVMGYDISEYPSPGSSTAVLKLLRGDEVFVRIWDHSPGADVQMTYSMFSGFLLQ